MTSTNQQSKPNLAHNNPGMYFVLSTSPYSGTTRPSLWASNLSIQAPSGSEPLPRVSGGITSADRPYLADKKKPFKHLRPKELLLNTVRVVFVQAGSVVTSTLSEQLEAETRREELVSQKKLTPKEAEEEAEAWEKREWKTQLEAFPKKVAIALVKHHACTLVMRLYEYLALYHSRLSIATVDKLTKDVHGSAKRKLERNHGDKMVTGRQMFVTSLYANAIAVLADATVHEMILVWSYSAYYYHHVWKIRKARTSKDEDTPVAAGGVFLSFCFKSCSIFVSRSLAWVASASGAVVGTMVLPGWGTTVGTQLGDNLAGVLFEKASESS